MYRVNAVDPAGTPWEVSRHQRAVDALDVLEDLQARYPFASSNRLHWVDDPDNEERGEISLDDVMCSCEHELYIHDQGREACAEPGCSCKAFTEPR